MKKIYKENILISMLAIWGTSAAVYGMRLGDDPLVLTNSVFSILACAGIWFLLKKGISILNKRLFWCAGILGLFFAGMCVIGSGEYRGDLYSMGENIYAILGLAPIFLSASALVICYYDIWIEKIKESRAEAWVIKKWNRCRKRVRFPLLFGTGCLFLCWLPGLLATFPGIYAYDSIFQTRWFVEGTISEHHPILHTYMVGGCLSIGKSLFGSYEIGMLLYSLIQMAVMAVIFAYIVRYIGRKLPKAIQIVTMLLFAFLPYNALFSFSATKDVLFAGIFAIVVIKSYEIVSDMDTFFENWKRPCAYAGWIFLMCAFRNNGFYAFLCLIPVVLIICRKYWKKVLCMCVAAVLCWNLYSGPVYSLLGIEEGRSAEMLSVPMQQLARVMCSDTSELTEKEKSRIIEYIPEFQRYSASVSDPVKDTFNSELFDKAPMEFIKLWISVGMKYPGVYINAFLRMNLGFWYPDMVYPDPDAYHPYIEYANSELEGDWILVERTSFIPALSHFFEKFAYETVHQKVPLVSMLFQPGFTFWMICLGITICIYKKRYEMAVPFSIMIGLWLTLMLSPVVLLRYAYPLMVSMPIVLLMCSEKSLMRSKNSAQAKIPSVEK